MTLPALDHLDNWLAASEARVPGVKPGNAKHVEWADDARVRRPWSVVYIHGFSASALELAPVPQRVARALGANLYMNRLTGHGVPGEAMGRATLAEWRADVAQDLAIGAALGERVLVISCSTGCTLVTQALADGASMAGAVMVSPNYGLFNKVGQWMLEAPLVRFWGPWIAGRTQTFPVLSPGHAAGWTTTYPTKSAFPMAKCVRGAMAANLGSVKVSALFVFSDADQVVDPVKTHAVMARWGGKVTHHPMVMGPDDDPNAHLVAGDVFSPSQNDGLVAAIAGWAQAL
jgi:esterase/lipase